jgi:hypothetical protein|tara:strand:- start:174 stop:593 length:420 start_codon:yes stop_codon:yes gene_type:complete
MADTVLNLTGATAVFDGAKKLITHYNVVSDSSGGTTKIVDVSALTTNPSTGAACSRVRLMKVSFNVSVTAQVDALRMAWDADTDVTFLTLNGEMEFDFSNFGGLKNTEATGATGDVNLTLPACTSGDTATVVCEWLKIY